MYFLIRVPLSSEDARLLEGRSPDDSKLLETMEGQTLNAGQIRMVIQNQQWAARSTDTGMTQMIGAIWMNFEQNRDTFCSRHPTMYVLDMKLDGITTPPIVCSASSKASN
jgi:hypothetical protein